MNKRSILFVDDETNVVNAIRRATSQTEYKIYYANSGKNGLSLLKKYPDISLVVSDHKMPYMLGSEFLEKVKNSYPDKRRYMLSGQGELNLVVDLVNKGIIDKFLVKPWDNDQLVQYIDDAFKTFNGNDHVVGERFLQLCNAQRQNVVEGFIDNLDLNLSCHTSEEGVLVIMINIINTEYLKDVLGLKKYQQLLSLVSTRISNFFKGSAYYAQLSESNYGVFLTKATDLEAAVIKVELLVEFLKMSFEIANQKVNCEISAGISSYPEHGATAEYLLRNASYAAQNNNKEDSVHVYNSGDY